MGPFEGLFYCPNPTEPTMTPTATPPRLSTLIFLSALSVLPVNMILPCLPNIAAEFRSPYWLVNLAVAGHAILSALTQFIGGALSDRYGRRPVALAATLIFILASIGCALSPDIGTFLFFRALQAPIIACYSIALAIIKETSGEREAAGKIGFVSMAWAVAPLVGPTFGGLLAGGFGWRADFVALALLGAALLAASFLDLRETSRRAAGHGIRYLGVSGQLLRSPRFRGYTLCMIFCIGTLYIFFGGAPLVAASRGISEAELGLFMGATPAGFILGSYCAGRIAARHALSTTVILGRIAACAGLLAGLILIAAGAPFIPAFFGSCVFIGIGNGLSMAAANASVLAVRPDSAGAAAGLAPALTTGGGVAIGALSGLFMTPQTGGIALSAMLLSTAVCALLAALYAASLDRRASIMTTTSS
jgi:DHA1 family bicyclomycin/chloramphenicol resistance-like MFS transporter